jgi:hypothetical protein
MIVSFIISCSLVVVSGIGYLLPEVVIGLEHHLRAV